MKTSRPGRLTTAALSLAAITASPALAQDGTGVRGNLSFSTGIEVSDNPGLVEFPDGTTLTSVTNLGFSVSSETRVDRFRFSLGAGIEGEEGGSSTTADALDVRRTDIALSYARDGANSQLSLSARYNEADIDDEVFGFFVDGEFDPDALIVEGGTRQLTRFSADFSTGLEAPFGVDLSFGLTSNDFVDVADPDLNDSDSRRLSATARFSINPSTTARLTGAYSKTDVDDLAETSRSTQSIGAGVTTQTRTGMELTADLSIDSAETLSGDVVTDEDDGLGLSFGVLQPRPDGAIAASLSSRIDNSGRRTSASVTRSFDLPTGGLTLSLGVVEQEDQDLEFTTRVGYTRQAAGGTLTANIVQSPSTSDGDAFLNTSLDLGFEAPINTVSSWGADFSYGSAAQFGEEDGDERTAAGVRYTRDLNEDWALNAGLRHVRISEDGANSRTSNTLFLNVGRDFSFGF
ncbi:MAG: hypothetical protein KJO30_09380 [Boseongicola sp.]|nr:hypothetical protein [Boseongicola sp.]NNJ69520.1 hypothetical protein [Boseongicola sp.]